MLEDEIQNLTAHIIAMTHAINTLTASIQTLTAAAVMEVESIHEKPMIEVLKYGTVEHAEEARRAGFDIEKPRKTEPKPHGMTGKINNARGRPKGLKERGPRRIMRSSCCGTEGRAMSHLDGKCAGCR